MTISDPRASQLMRDTQVMPAGATPNLPGDHCRYDTQVGIVAGDISTRNGHMLIDNQEADAVAGSTPGLTRQLSSPIEGASARDHISQPTIFGTTPKVRPSAGDPNSPVAMTAPLPTTSAPPGDQDCGDQSGTDNQACSVAASNPLRPANVHVYPNTHAPVLAAPLLALSADVLDDLEKVRIANQNRLRQLTRDETDKDGEERGFGLTLDHPDVARLSGLVDALVKAEHDATLNLQRMVRKHPLGPWIKATRGIGEKQGARLLAAIGDPYWNDLHNRPRMVSELWAYTGYHVLPAGQWWLDPHLFPASGNGGDPDQLSHGNHSVIVGVAATPKRGQRANWSATAKMRAHLIAESIVKAGGPYREVYDQGREKYADAVHKVDCKRCGPSGKPAPIGSPLSAGHQHARALRLVAKEVLKGLWCEAKRLHEEMAS